MKLAKLVNFKPSQKPMKTGTWPTWPTFFRALRRVFCFGSGLRAEAAMKIFEQKDTKLTKGRKSAAGRMQ